MWFSFFSCLSPCCLMSDQRCGSSRSFCSGRGRRKRSSHRSRNTSPPHNSKSPSHSLTCPQCFLSFALPRRPLLLPHPCCPERIFPEGSPNRSALRVCGFLWHLELWKTINSIKCATLVIYMTLCTIFAREEARAVVVPFGPLDVEGAWRHHDEAPILRLGADEGSTFRTEAADDFFPIRDKVFVSTHDLHSGAGHDSNHMQRTYKKWLKLHDRSLQPTPRFRVQSLQWQ